LVVQHRRGSARAKAFRHASAEGDKDGDNKMTKQ
jgi:hypothetical protein